MAEDEVKENTVIFVQLIGGFVFILWLAYLVAVPERYLGQRHDKHKD